MMNRLTVPSRHLLRDERGNFTMFLAFAAPPILLLIAGLVNYSNTITLQQKTQAAADAASLAGTTAFARGAVTTAANAQAIAASFFADNAPPQAVQGQSSFGAMTVTPSSAGSSHVSTTVNYCGTAPSLVGWVGGNLNKFCVTSTSTANITVSGGGSALVYGDAENWGDPHEIGADGYDFEAHCTPGTWYVVFSDANLQINGLCENYYSGPAQVFSDLAITVGGHQVYVTNFNDTSGSFSGSFQYNVDGISSNQTVAGNYTLFNTPSGYSMSLTVADSHTSDSYNYFQLNTPNYVVTINYSNYGVIHIATTSSSYVSCSTPAGLLGQTFGAASSVDTSGFDFAVPGGSNDWYVSPNFSATCVTVTSGSEARITQ